MMEKIKEAVGYIQTIYSAKPTVGIVLGSGLGTLQRRLTSRQKFLILKFPIFL